jgi:hypothetical protein
VLAFKLRPKMGAGHVVLLTGNFTGFIAVDPCRRLADLASDTI